jgi:hypothetical protein
MLSVDIQQLQTRASGWSTAAYYWPIESVDIPLLYTLCAPYSTILDNETCETAAALIYSYSATKYIGHWNVICLFHFCELQLLHKAECLPVEPADITLL